MLSTCSGADTQRRRLQSDCYQKQQFVFVFEEFEFCIKELVFSFLFKLSAEKERNRNPQFIFQQPAEEQLICFEEQIFRQHSVCFEKQFFRIEEQVFRQQLCDQKLIFHQQLASEEERYCSPRIEQHHDNDC